MRKRRRKKKMRKEDRKIERKWMKGTKEVFWSSRSSNS